MDKVNNRQVRDSEFWKNHILRATEFAGSNLEYCRQNGLSPSSFSTQRRRLGFRGSRVPRRGAFIKVRPALSTPRPINELWSQGKTLPDPRWLAQLVRSLTSER